jgi:hypothetical protein
LKENIWLLIAEKRNVGCNPIHILQQRYITAKQEHKRCSIQVYELYTSKVGNYTRKTTAFIRKKKQLNALEEHEELVLESEITDACCSASVRNDRCMWYPAVSADT